MSGFLLHHVSINVTDLDGALDFYQTVLGLPRLQRPPFPSAGAWLACGSSQIHLNPHPADSWPHIRRISPVHPHFALRTADFDGWVARLAAQGFRADLPEADPKRIRIDIGGLAGFAQLFLTDPDCNLIEINAAP